MPRLKQLVVTLPLDLHRRLKTRAAEQGVSMTALVIDAVKRLLQAPFVSWHSNEKGE